MANGYGLKLPTLQYRSPTDPNAQHGLATLAPMIQAARQEGERPTKYGSIAKGVTKAVEVYQQAAARSQARYDARQQASQKRHDEWQNKRHQAFLKFTELEERADASVKKAREKDGTAAEVGLLARAQDRVKKEYEIATALSGAEVGSDVRVHDIGGQPKVLGTTTPDLRFADPAVRNTFSEAVGRGEGLAALSLYNPQRHNTWTTNEKDTLIPGKTLPYSIRDLSGNEVRRDAPERRFAVRVSAEEILGTDGMSILTSVGGYDEKEARRIIDEIRKQGEKTETPYTVQMFSSEPDIGAPDPSRLVGTVEHPPGEEGEKGDLSRFHLLKTYIDTEGNRLSSDDLRAYQPRWATRADFERDREVELGLAERRRELENAAFAAAGVRRPTSASKLMDRWDGMFPEPEVLDPNAPVTRLQALLARRRGGLPDALGALRGRDDELPTPSPQSNTQTDRDWMAALEEEEGALPVLEEDEGSLPKLEVERDPVLPTPDRTMGAVEERLGRYTNSLTAKDARMRGNSVVELRGKDGKWHKWPVVDLDAQFLLRLPDEVKRKLGISTKVEAAGRGRGGSGLPTLK